MLIPQYISSTNFKDMDRGLIEKLLWLGAKLGFRAVKRKHGGMLLMVSRRKIRSNYEKIRNNRLDHKVGKFVFNSDVEELILKHGVEDGAILIDRKGSLIDNNCALPLQFKKRNNSEVTHGGVRRATAINVTKRFKALALMIRSNGLIVIVYRGKIIGIIKYAETSYGNIVPLVEKVNLSYFPETESFDPTLKNKVHLVSMEKLIMCMERPYVARLDFFQDRCRFDVEWEPEKYGLKQRFPQKREKTPQYVYGNPPHITQRTPSVNWNIQNLENLYRNGVTPTMARQVYDMIWQNANINPPENRNNLQLPIRTGERERTSPRRFNNEGNDVKGTVPNPHMAAIINSIYAIMNRGSRRNEP